MSFLESAKEKYDVVVVDSPPVLIVTEARIIARHTDMVLVVSRWNLTTKRQVNQCMSMFASIGVKVNSLVMNGIKEHGMRRYGMAIPPMVLTAKTITRPTR